MARIPNNELDRLKREVALVRLVESSGIEKERGQGGQERERKGVKSSNI